MTPPTSPYGDSTPDAAATDRDWLAKDRDSWKMLANSANARCDRLVEVNEGLMTALWEALYGLNFARASVPNNDRGHRIAARLNEYVASARAARAGTWNPESPEGQP